MKVHFAATPAEQVSQLRAWGLEAGPLVEAVLWARGFYADCTPLHPRGYKFIHAYAEAGRRVRELHITRGWAVCDLNNQTAIRHERLKLRLYPCNFCSATADPNGTPKNLSDKGSAAEGDARNNRQAELFPHGLPQIVPDAEVETVQGYTTLVLGMNFEDEFPKAEVALPIRFMDGRFKAFLKRVPLLDGKSGPLLGGKSSSPAPEPKHDGDEAFGEVDIPIKVVS